MFTISASIGRSCGTCQEFGPIWEKSKEGLGNLARFGTVNIDDEAGMALAKRLDIFEEARPRLHPRSASLAFSLSRLPARFGEQGIPNVRAYVTHGSSESLRVFSGWELPTAAELEQKVRATLDAARAGDASKFMSGGADAPMTKIAAASSH